MFVKHPLGLRVPSVVCLAGWMLLIPRLFCATTTCPLPDFPEGGSYTPKKTEYEVGSRVHYSCKDKLTMFGKDQMFCQSNGRWSGKTPFCDSPTKLKNPIATSKINNMRESAVIDGSPNTCFQTRNGTEQYVRVFLDRPAAVYAVRMYLPKGKHAFKIVLSQTARTDLRFRLPSKAANCQTHDRESAEGEWTLFICELNEDIKAEFVTIQVNSGTAHAIQLCKIEVYSKDDQWCEDPTENFIPNGQLEVSRNRANLNCNEGFKVKDDRRVYATCESNKWTRLFVQCIEILCESVISNISLSEGEWHIEGKTSKLSIGTKVSLKCRPGYQPEGKPLLVTCHKTGNWTKTSATCEKDKDKKDYKILAIAIGSVVVLIILFLLGLTIFLIQRKRSREVVVIYKPGENNSYSTPPSIGGHSIAGLSEAEYSTVYYEAIQNSQHDPRAPPPKPPNLVPKLERGYSKPVDDRTPYANTGIANQLPSDLAFGTLTKSSSLYNTMS